MKLSELKKQIEDTIIDIIAIEDAFLSSNVKIALKLGMVRGACIVASGDRKIITIEPKLVKKNITGNGSADKNQVAYMTSKLVQNFSPKTDDESDACAIAICAGLLHSR